MPSPPFKQTPPPPGWKPKPCPDQPPRNEKHMALNPIADAIVKMEGADLPSSVNMHMVRDYGLWNVGHLVWAGQYGATKVWMGDRWWAGWPTREDAYAGLLRDLAAKARAGHTISSAMYKYAPPKENRTENYIQYIVDQTGWSRDTPLSAILAGTVTPVSGNAPAADPLFLDTADTDNSGAPVIINDDGTVSGGGGGAFTLDFNDPGEVAAIAGLAFLLLYALTR